MCQKGNLNVTVKHKINILTPEKNSLGLYYHFWNFFYFSKDFKDLGIQIEFFSSITEKIYDADFIFLNSKSIPKHNQKVDINYLKKFILKIEIYIGLILEIVQEQLNLKCFHL